MTGRRSPTPAESDDEVHLICTHCGIAIGVYEPVVLVADGDVRETSRAAAPLAVARARQRFHRACYDAGLEVGEEACESR